MNRTIKIFLLTAGVLLSLGASVARAAVGVDFTLSLDKDVDAGLNYNRFNRAGAGMDDTFVVGFQIEITSVDGVALTTPLGPIAAFCAEIQESISTGGHSYTLNSLSALSAGQAGFSGTASSNIPTGGIGAARAARLAYLFDQFYISDALDAWAMSDVNPSLHAFQLAVWEITHDDGLSLSSGAIHLGTQSGGSNLTRRTNAAALAQTYLDAVSAAGIVESYTSDKFKFWALTDIGSPGSQDIILALEKGTEKEQEFEGVIPEARSTVLLVGSFALLCALAGRPKRHR